MNKKQLILLFIIGIFLLATGCKDTTNEDGIVSLNLSEASITLELNEEKLLIAEVYPANINIDWSSENPSIASVSNTGLVKAISVGTTIVTVKADGVIKTVEVNVEMNENLVPKTIEITGFKDKLFIGASLQLGVIIDPSAALNTVIWSSSDENIATVDQTGKVIAVGVGEVQITVTSSIKNEVSKSVSINVEEEVGTISRIIFKDNNSIFSFNLNSFKLEDIKLEIEYSNQSKELISVTKDMLSETDFKLLFTTGTYFIKILYMDTVLEALIQMTSDDGSQYRLPEVLIYSLKTINNGKVVYDFYSIGTFVSYELLLNFDFSSTKLEIISNIGSFAYGIEGNELIILHSFGLTQSGTNHLFRITITEGDGNLFYVNEQSNFYDYHTSVYIIEDVKYFHR